MSQYQVYHCERCHDSGFISEYKITEWTEKLYGVGVGACFAVPCPDCNGGHEIKTEERRKKTNMPQSQYGLRLRDFDFDLYVDETGKKVNTKQVEFVVSSLIKYFPDYNAVGRGLYIYSKKRGSGKTRLSFCLCNEIIDRYEIAPQYVRAIDLFEISKQNEEKSNQSKLSVLKNSEVLFIDDLGQEHTGENWMHNILVDIIDFRYSEHLTTIITSNILPKDLPYDDTIATKINEMCQLVHLPEICVRTSESRKKTEEFYKEIQEKIQKTR